jgi:exodeoxyribonuclease V alpha subunit
MGERIDDDDSRIPGETQEGATLNATLLGVVYSSPGSTYVVGRFEVEGELFPIVATGDMYAPSAGDAYHLSGEWVQHPKYGRQFRFTSYEIAYPATREGIERYLASGLIRGIGPGTARKIVDAFGTDAMKVLNTDIDRLRDIPGIGEKKLSRIRTSWQEQRAVQNVMLFLKEHDVSTGFAVQIYKVYGQRAIDIMSADPYQMVRDVERVGFVIADRIAAKLGIAPTDPRRLAAGISYALGEASRSGGHACLPFQDCVHAAMSILGASEQEILPVINAALADNTLVQVDDRIYVPELLLAERAIAVSLRELFGQPPRMVDHSYIEERVRAIESERSISFSPVQVEAIHKSVIGPMVIVTGGPGTGKTTAVAGILAIASGLELRVAMCAPTGRAAKRLSELTGFEARTIHRLLEFEPRSGVFLRNDNRQLELDLLIVDEMSMVDVQLMAALLRAVPAHARLVLVGDVDQLPSVGPGNVLGDLIESDTIETVVLHYVYRQAENSSIISNAHRIRSGYVPVFDGRRETFFIEREHPDSIAKMIRDLVVTRLPREMKLDPVAQIQVLSPMHDTATGVRNLNAILEQDLNPRGRIVYQKGDRTFRLGDKVMQTRNNYTKDVYNGDIGLIDLVDDEEALVRIRFDDRTVEYAFDELDDLILAYAATIHKSQGSEYDVVVIPVSMQHARMLQRNLLYTAVTRARSMLICVGQMAALEYAVSNTRIARRNTGLKDLLKQTLR